MKESEYIHKEHNVSALLYHLVFPAKYRRAVLSELVDEVIKETCLEIEKRYEIAFIEIGSDLGHIHLLVQSVPMYSITEIVKIVKSITAREVFRLCPEVKKQLWGGEFWSSGYFAATVGQHGNEANIANYVKNQGKKDYKKTSREKTIGTIWVDTASACSAEVYYSRFWRYIFRRLSLL